MKRSKIYLGLTTCVLAIVGLAAAKANKFNTKHNGYYLTNTLAGPCTHESFNQYFTQGTKTAFTGSKPVYTKQVPGTCSGHRLYSNETGTD